MSAAFDRVLRYEEGLWLLSLYSDISNEVDHVILFDAKRGLILDPAEDHAIKAPVESIRVCAGQNVHRLQIAEVLELYKR